MSGENDLLKILAHYGHEAQIEKTKEELFELGVALCHHKKKPVGTVIDELADVFIMVSQMALVFGKDEVNDAIRKKIARQLQRMKE